MRSAVFVLSTCLLACHLVTVATFSTSTLISMNTAEPDLRVSPQTGLKSALSRRNLLAALSVVVVSPPLREAHARTPVRAPLPPGPPNPEDKQKLLDAEKLIEGWGSTLKDPASWPSIADAVSKAPLSPDALDELFRYAAKNLPANNLLGTDAGQWAGLKVESVQAMENFASEVTFLSGESKKGAKNLDTADLLTYHTELVSKMKDFIALYDNKIENKYLPQLSGNKPAE
mmetsp:Transcript_56169/g.131612  ORF Transcript_56169/g.131612 Transcript_56169/m.131612 type:complete len:230 (+) Transcript_56169:91-780(+)